MTAPSGPGSSPVPSVPDSSGDRRVARLGIAPAAQGVRQRLAEVTVVSVIFGVLFSSLGVVKGVAAGALFWFFTAVLAIHWD
jgi:ABC-type microcin C transport system permease subunit YejE